jgi:hypothetical protein
MSIKVRIEDGDGSGNRAKVTEGGYVFVQDSNLPPVDDRDLQIIYRKNLTLNGDGTTTEMTVDGSTTPQLFTIDAIPEKDIYITSLSIFVQATSLTLGEDFAGSNANTGGVTTALPNGCRLYYEDKNGEINIGTDIVVNFDFIRLCQGNAPFGDNSTAFIKTDGTPTIFPILSFKKVFGFQSGLRLLRDTTDKLVFEINDDLIAGGTILPADASINIIANGFELK